MSSSQIQAFMITYTQKTVYLNIVIPCSWFTCFQGLLLFSPQHIRFLTLLVNSVLVICRAFSAIFSHFFKTLGKYPNCVLWNEARRICWDFVLVTNVDRLQIPLYSVLLLHLPFGISARYTPSCPIYGYLAYLSEAPEKHRQGVSRALITPLHAGLFNCAQSETSISKQCW